jgi:hypothetical protein
VIILVSDAILLQKQTGGDATAANSPVLAAAKSNTHKQTPPRASKTPSQAAPNRNLDEIRPNGTFFNPGKPETLPSSTIQIAPSF